MADIIQLRRGTSAAWTSANPTLASGELGVETDTSKIKIGTGLLAWNDLPYLTGDTVVATDYTYVQSVPASTWSITHNLGYNPSVNVVDSAGNNVRGAVTYNTLNTLTISFTAGFSGTAYLS